MHLALVRLLAAHHDRRRAASARASPFLRLEAVVPAAGGGTTSSLALAPGEPTPDPRRRPHAAHRATSSPAASRASSSCPSASPSCSARRPCAAPTSIARSCAPSRATRAPCCAYGARAGAAQRAAAADPRRRRARPTRLDPWDEQLALHGAALIARPGPRSARAPGRAVRASISRLLGGRSGARARATGRGVAGRRAAPPRIAERRSRDIAAGRRPAPARTWTTSCCTSTPASCAPSARQGEQRTAVLALLLAEASAASRELRGEPPVLLLDDVLSELDADRRARLLRAVRGRRPGDRDHDRGRRTCPSRPTASWSSAAEGLPCRSEARRRPAGSDAAAVVRRGVAAADAPRLARRGRRTGGARGVAGPDDAGRHARRARHLVAAGRSELQMLDGGRLREKLAAALGAARRRRCGSASGPVPQPSGARPRAAPRRAGCRGGRGAPCGTGRGRPVARPRSKRHWSVRSRGPAICRIPRNDAGCAGLTPRTLLPCQGRRQAGQIRCDPARDAQPDGKGGDWQTPEYGAKDITSSRVSRRSGVDPACTSAPPARAACTTSSTRCSTTRRRGARRALRRRRR